MRGADFFTRSKREEDAARNQRDSQLTESKAASPARLELFDVDGRRVAVREVGTLGAGKHVVTLGDERRLSPGVYLLRLSQGIRTVTARAVILR